jgi:hypothetical protein
MQNLLSFANSFGELRSGDWMDRIKRSPSSAVNAKLEATDKGSQLPSCESKKRQTSVSAPCPWLLNKDSAAFQFRVLIIITSTKFWRVHCYNYTRKPQKPKSPHERKSSRGHLLRSFSVIYPPPPSNPGPDSERTGGLTLASSTFPRHRGD